MQKSILQLRSGQELQFKMQNRLKQKKRHSAGQMLLVVMLVMIVGLTVGLFLTSRTTTDISLTTKITESSRAFNASEAGIEEAIRAITAVPAGTPVPFASGLTYTVNSADLGTTGIYPAAAAEPTNVGEAFTVWLVPHDDTTGELIVGDTITAGLQGQWKMDENSGTTTADASGNGYTGTLVNGPTWATGRSGSGINFDGENDYIITGNVFNPTNAYTVTMWAYLRTTSTDDAFFSSSTSDSDSNLALYIGNGANNNLVYCNGGACASTANSQDNVLTDNSWQHIAFVYNGMGTATFHINGLNVTSDSTTSETDDSGNKIFGNYDTANSFAIDGILDDVRVYNRVLSQGEIQAIAGVGTVFSDLHLCYSDNPDTTPAVAVTLFYADNSDGGVIKSSYAAYDSLYATRGAGLRPADTDLTNCGGAGGGYAYHVPVDLETDFNLALANRIPLALRIRPLYAATSIAINNLGGALPKQGNDITSTGTSGVVSRRISVQEPYVFQPPFLDYVLYSTGNNPLVK